MKKYLTAQKYRTVEAPWEKGPWKEGTSYTHVGRNGDKWWTLYTQEKSEYPAMMPSVSLFDMRDGGCLLDKDSTKDFVSALSSVLYAANTSDYAPSSHDCVALVKDGCLWRAYTTDGHRIAASYPIMIRNDGLPSEIKIPYEIASAAVRSRKLISQISIMAGHGFGQISARMTGGGAETVAWQSDHVVPAYAQVMSKSRVEGIVIDRKRLIAAIVSACRRLRGVSTKGGRKNWLDIKLDSVGLHITAEGETDSATCDVTRITTILAEIDTRVCRGYLMDAIKAIKCDIIKIAQSERLAPIHIYDRGTCDELATIMPMRV